MAWYRKGLDPDREMIKLSTYLGHSKPENTYWYIEACRNAATRIGAG